MSYTYNTGVPAANNNPSDDQPDMLTNTQSINSLIGVDHVSFNDSLGGTHKQVTITSKNAGAAQTDPSSVLYTGNGTASSVAQLFYKNQNGTFLLSGIRAWAYVNGSGSIVSSQSFNVSGITKSGSITGNYTVTLTANSTSSANYGVFCTPSTVPGSSPPNAMAVGYVINSATSFTLQFNAASSGNRTDPSFFTFIVFQI